MLVKFFPGKLACFAALMLLVFLLAMPSFGKVNVVAQAGDTSDEELARTLVLETARGMGLFDPENPEINTLIGEYGCSTGNAIYDVGGGGIFTRAFAIVFPTAADAEAYATRLLAGEVTCGHGDEQKSPWWRTNSVPITFHGIQAVQSNDIDDGVEGYRRDFLGWPMKNFFIGCWEMGINGNRQTGCAEYMYNVALQHGLGENVLPDPNPIEPDPYIDPNPNPDPAPSPIDPQVISILQSILSTPALPITGAIAGGLVAWVISMLGGSRTVLPTPPRPPTGGVRPGQVGPDGKIWSPGQGWVSKSTYDYQQKWLQKGWRLNPQTNKLEVQPGAVNDSGQVWYKLPHEMDEGDSHYWVDKAKVQECERNLADGMVWDRNLGWQATEDLNRFESEREGIRQRGREFSAEKNAQIQRELKEAQAQRDRAFQEKMRKIDAQRAGEIKANMEMYQKRAQQYMDWDKQLENAAYIAQTVETVADVGVAVCARLTGPAGKAIAAAYETAKEAATTADDVIASDDVVGKAEELGDDKIKDEYKEKIKEKIEEKVTPYIPKFVNRIANQIKRPIKKFILRKTGKTGLIIYQEAEKKFLDYAKEKGEEFVEGQIETAVEEIKNNIDPNLLTGI